MSSYCGISKQFDVSNLGIIGAVFCPADVRVSVLQNVAYIYNTQGVVYSKASVLIFAATYINMREFNLNSLIK
jgi:hypothetical protein